MTVFETVWLARLAPLGSQGERVARTQPRFSLFFCARAFSIPSVEQCIIYSKSTFNTGRLETIELYYINDAQ